MLPAINIPPFDLFGLTTVKPFYLLIAIAVVFGHFMGKRRARQVGLDDELMADGNIWAIAIGFVGAHLVSVIFYFPEKVLKDPLVLLALWNGMSSYGGLIGAFVGAWVFYRRRGAYFLEYADPKIFGFVPAWIFGRLGCVITFDHPGLVTDFVLGMSDKMGIPRGHWGLYWDGVVRHNLGFYEWLLAILLTTVLFVTAKYRPYHGFHCTVMLLIYAPARFAMDWLRIRDTKYLGLTPAQYLSILGILAAALVTWVGLRHPRPAEQAQGRG